MTLFEKYFCEELPRKCGYSEPMIKAIGDLVRLGLKEERENPDFMNADNLDSYERGSFLLPYNSKEDFNEEYWHGLHVAYACVVKSDIKKHPKMFDNIKDSEAAFEKLKLELTDDEKEIVAAGYWDY